jgi:hypothetical protein
MDIAINIFIDICMNISMDISWIYAWIYLWIYPLIYFWIYHGYIYDVLFLCWIWHLGDSRNKIKTQKRLDTQSDLLEIKSTLTCVYL